MSLTATNFINLINSNYPVRGQDNDSQGFRDNFNNISGALYSINSQVDFINLYAVITTNTNNTFYGNTISDANFQNCSTEMYDNGEQNGNITIDYSLGSYQKIELDPGLSNITIINWPAEGTVGDLILSITPVQDELTTVNFVDSQSTTTYVLSYGINLYGLYHEYPVGGSPNLLVTLLNLPIINSTSTVANEFVLDSNGTYFSYNIGINTGSANATVVSSQLPNNVYTAVGNIALVPNVISSNVTEISKGASLSTISLASAAGIFPGAMVTLPITGGGFTTTAVISANTTEVTINNPNIASSYGDYLIFKNQTFQNIGEDPTGFSFPSLSTFANTGVLITQQGEDGIAGGFLGTLTNFKGSIYSNPTHLEVTFADPDNINTNTFIIDTMPLVSQATSATVADTSTNLATAFFVHSLLPYGSIIMWYGNSTNVPAGWQICDGTNGTPDLRDQFIVGASSDYNQQNPASIVAGVSTSSGGQASLQLPQHTHDLLNTDALGIPDHIHSITDPTHFHEFYYATGSQASGSGSHFANLNGADGAYVIADGNSHQIIQNAATGITQTNSPTVPLTITGADTLALTSSTTTDPIATGAVWSTDVTYANIPPFIAVYYIMKISGGGIYNTALAVG